VHLSFVGAIGSWQTIHTFLGRSSPSARARARARASASARARARARARAGAGVSRNA
jgi:hypothetical protein